MANYYWLGVTGGCGNVNNPANWTLWSPQGACGFLPPAAATGPAYNDTIIFTKFNVSGACYGVDYYPQVQPIGQIYGRTGPNAIQQFLLTKVEGDYPLGLGTSTNYFKFNSTTIELNSNPSNTLAANKLSYIDVGKHTLVTGNQYYPSIFVNSGVVHTYYIKGQARYLYSYPNNYTTRAAIHLRNLELTSGNNETSIWITPLTGPNITSMDSIYLYDTTTGYNGFEVGGNATVFIYEGFSQSLETTLQAGLNPLYSTHTPQLIFANSGYCGPDMQYPRSYISNLVTAVGTKTSCSITLSHGVDIVNLELKGGNLSNYTPAESNGSVVQRGYMHGLNSAIVTYYPTLTLGANGSFVVYDNSQQTYKPDITFRGNMTVYMNPGPNGISV